MATTLKIQRFTRYVRQGRTAEKVSVLTMPAATQQAYDALVSANWRRVDDKMASLPRHNWAQTGFSNQYDASKYCGDYANSYQNAYATAVCYAIRMPADAFVDIPAKIVSLSIPAYGDRWLTEGCDIGVYLSASATPPDWDSVPDASLTGQMAVVPSNTGTDSYLKLSFDWSLAPKDAPIYLHITLRLTDYLTHRLSWIEGGAMLDGDNIEVAFDRDVIPDTEAVFDDFQVVTAYNMPQSATWDLYRMGSRADFTKYPASQFSPPALDYYQTCLAAMSLPHPYKVTTADPSGFVWAHNGDAATAGKCTAGFWRSDAGSPLVHYTQVVASVYGRSALLPYTNGGHTMYAVSLGAALPAPPLGMGIRVALYGAPAYRGNAYLGDGMTDYSIHGPYRISPGTAATPSFWRGTALTAAGCKYGIEGYTTDASAGLSTKIVPFDILPLKSFVTTAAISTADKLVFDTLWKCPGHPMVLIAISVAWITAAPEPMQATETAWGVTWPEPSLKFYIL